MDKSIANLQKSLADMRINTKSLKSLREDPDFVNETSLNTTEFDDTQEQLKRDINLDKSDISSRNSAPFSNSNVSQRSASTSSPWRKLRSAPKSAPTHIPPGPQLRFNAPDINLRSKASDSSSNTEVISELNKQLTGYKIQIRFFKQLLQKLIEKKDFNQNDPDLPELKQFNEQFSPIKKMRSNSSTNEQAKLEVEFKNLSESYDEIFKLNKDLYANLEQFEQNLKEKEQNISQLKERLFDYNLLANEIIQTLISDATTDIMSRKALVRCLENTSENAMDVKLHAIQMELSKKLETSKEKELKRNSFTSTSSVTVVDREKQFEINNYIRTIHQLMSALEQLRTGYDEQNKLVSQMKEELDYEIEQSEQLKANNTIMKSSLDTLSDTIDQTSSSLIDNREVDSLRSQNQQLIVLNDTMKKKYEEYQHIIDHLQDEVRDIQHLNHNTADVSELNQELLQSHKDFNQLQEEYNDLHDKYTKLKEDSSNTVSSLTNQLQSNKQESLSSKADKIVLERMEQDLNLAVEKQRMLKAEKIRLTYKVESLSKEKISLQTTIQNLTDKVTDLTIANPATSRNDEVETALTKKINILEYQIGELLQLDTFKFQRLLKSFNKIADDASLKEPTRKVDYMIKKLMPNNSSNDSNMSSVDFTDMTNIREFHKAVFDYFTRAVDVIVNDHVKLLLKENEDTAKSGEYVNKLHKRIDELNRLNDELSRSMESSNASNEYSESSISSPRAELRIDELNRRWKAEREARVYENHEAERRLKELEQENTRLREQLNLTG
ncbi:hypothetical protein PSN45_005321 [Yamadazyma tenuis]|nr:hypothetical protein PSN45_005321 [Yamadazyma tenuis]